MARGPGSRGFDFVPDLLEFPETFFQLSEAYLRFLCFPPALSLSRDITTPGENEDRARARLKRKDILVATVGSGPGPFPSRSWSHSEDAPRWLARLILTGLFEHAWKKFEHLMGFKPPLNAIAVQAADAGGGLDVGEIEEEAAPLQRRTALLCL